MRRETNLNLKQSQRVVGNFETEEMFPLVKHVYNVINVYLKANFKTSPL